MAEWANWSGVDPTSHWPCVETHPGSQVENDDWGNELSFIIFIFHRHFGAIRVWFVILSASTPCLYSDQEEIKLQAKFVCA